MTPLEAAQAIIDARARATMGEWKHGRDISHFDAPEVVTDRYSGHIPVLEDAEFIAIAANHAAAVAQAYIDAEKRVAELVELVEYWAKVISYESTASSNQMTEQLARIMGKETHDERETN
jgi:hypothetical protein